MLISPPLADEAATVLFERYIVEHAGRRRYGGDNGLHPDERKQILTLQITTFKAITAGF